MVAQTGFFFGLIAKGLPMFIVSVFESSCSEACICLSGVNILPQDFGLVDHTLSLTLLIYWGGQGKKGQQNLKNSVVRLLGLLYCTLIQLDFI